VNAEGKRLTAYKCTADTWTIGVGHTGLDLYEGLTTSKETSHLLLAHDVAAADAAVDRLIHVPLAENQRFTLISFVFRLGEGRLRDSTLLRILNQGDYASVT